MENTAKSKILTSLNAVGDVTPYYHNKGSRHSKEGNMSIYDPQYSPAVPTSPTPIQVPSDTLARSRRSNTISVASLINEPREDNKENASVEHRKCFSHDISRLRLQLHKQALDPLQDIHEQATPSSTEFPASLIIPTTSLFCSNCSEPLANLGVVFEPCNHTCCSLCLINSLTVNKERCGFCKAAIYSFKSVNTFITSPTLPERGDGDFFNKSTVPRDRSSLTSIWSSENATRRAPSISSTLVSPPPVISSAPPAPEVGKLTFSDDWPVLKLENVPWDSTPLIVERWLPKDALPQWNVNSHAIHVVLDRNNGKASSDLYVEVVSTKIRDDIMRTKQHSVLESRGRSRYVNILASSQDELFRAIFPSWCNNNGDYSKLISDHELGTLIDLCERVGKKAIQRMPPKMHFCKEQQNPFNMLMSIVSKMPWSSIPRDKRKNLYRRYQNALNDCVKSWYSDIKTNWHIDVFTESIEIILLHIEANEESIDVQLLIRLLTVAFACPAFNDEQKDVFLLMSKLDVNALPSASIRHSYAPKLGLGLGALSEDGWIERERDQLKEQGQSKKYIEARGVQSIRNSRSLSRFGKDDYKTHIIRPPLLPPTPDQSPDFDLNAFGR